MPPHSIFLLSNMTNNIFWQQANVTSSDREKINSHKGAVIWLTGLSSSGKSTIALALEEQLFKTKYSSFILDGDNIRHGLCKDLSFSIQDRKENIRRISEVSKLFCQAGIITIVSFISPIQEDREFARTLVGPDKFFEVYCNCPLSECERRDVKGLYKKARRGEIKEFTGISSPYEAPNDPELVIDTHLGVPDELVCKILYMLKTKNIIP